MPTGYTAALYEGEQSFEQFVWRIARGFGALIHLRDESPKSKITLPDDESEDTRRTNHLTEQLEKYIKELHFLNNATKVQLRQKLDSEHFENVERLKQSRKNERDRFKRYSKMMKKVLNWIPPTDDHIRLKKLMIEQINTSIEYDCHGMNDPLPRKKALKIWLKETKDSVQRSIVYYTEELKEQDKKDTGAKDWIIALDNSVPCPKEIKGW